MFSVLNKNCTCSGFVEAVTEDSGNKLHTTTFRMVQRFIKTKNINNGFVFCTITN